MDKKKGLSLSGAQKRKKKKQFVEECKKMNIVTAFQRAAVMQLQCPRKSDSSKSSRNEHMDSAVSENGSHIYAVSENEPCVSEENEPSVSVIVENEPNVSVIMEIESNVSTVLGNEPDTCTSLVEPNTCTSSSSVLETEPNISAAFETEQSIIPVTAKKDNTSSVCSEENLRNTSSEAEIVFANESCGIVQIYNIEELCADPRQFHKKIIPNGQGDFDGKDRSGSHSNVSLDLESETKAVLIDYNSSKLMPDLKTKAAGTKPRDPVVSVPSYSLEFREYVNAGPYRPILESYPRRDFSGKKRSFQSKWYADHSWLEYSNEKDAAFCFPCRLFSFEDATQGHSNFSFTKTGFTNWKNATKLFQKHETSFSHCSSTESLKNYKFDIGINKMLDASQVIQAERRQIERQNNREVMLRIIEIVRLLVLGGRPFRGHSEKTDDVTRGLFLDIVKLVSKFDDVLRNHLEHGKRNALNLSNRIQNDLIATFHNLVLQETINEVRDKSICLIADETTDCGHHEQLAVVVRYFDEITYNVHERFVGLMRVEKTDAATIFKTLNTVVEGTLKTSWNNVTSVCFDGASTMSGEHNGVQAKCKAENDKILYIHCYSHCLNLCLVDACTSRINNDIVFDFFGTVQCAYTFIEGSATRHAVLESIMQSLNKKLITLKSISKTRWACRAEAVEALKKQLPVIVDAISAIIKNSKCPEIRVSGTGILKQLKRFEFIIGLEMMSPVLLLVNKVSKVLQTEDINLITAMEEVDTLRASLVSLRSEESFHKIYMLGKVVAESMSIEETEIRKRKVSKKQDENWENQIFFESLEDKIRITGFYPVIDTMVAALDERFNQETQYIIRSVGKIVSLQACRSDCEAAAKIFGLCESDLETEIRLLQNSKFSNGQPKSIRDWLNWLKTVSRTEIYKTFNKVLQQFATLGVTSCKAERVFSKMTFVKTKLRSTMTQERLDNMLLPFVEQQITSNISSDKIINEFKSLIPGDRRMIL